MMKQSIISQLNNIAEQPRYTPDEIKKVMKKHGLNERSLAIILNLSPYTVRQWTNGKAKPCNPSCRLLQIMELYPGIVGHIAAKKTQ